MQAAIKDISLELWDDKAVGPLWSTMVEQASLN